MKGYLAILKARFATLFQYRAAALAGLATQVFWGAVKGMILVAFYAEGSLNEPISLSQGIAFIWIGQALLQLIPWNLDKEVEIQVKSGDVAYELTRPLDLFWLWFSRSLAMRIVPTFFRCIPIFLVAFLFFNLSAPVSWLAGASFFLSVLFSVVLSTSITTLLVISLFRTISGEGIMRLVPHTTILLSGLVVPLPLFPNWLQPFLSIQPFRFIVDVPCRIYTGVIPLHEVPFYFLFQWIWIAIFILFGKFLISRAIKKFVIQGG